MAVVWEDPPPILPSVGRPPQYSELFDSLRANPDKWALGTWRIYVRYIGGAA